MAVQSTSSRATKTPIPALIQRNTAFLASIQAVVGAGMQLVPALGAIQVVAFLGNATFAGITTALMGLARVFTAVPVGRLTDQYGRKAGLYGGLWFSLVGGLVVGVATLLPSFVLFCIGVLLFGIGVGAIQQMRVAAADMYPASRRSEGISLIMMGSLFGAFISPGVVALGQFLGKIWGISDIALAWILFSLLVIPLFLLAIAIKPDPKIIGQNLADYYPAESLQSSESRTVQENSRVRISAIVTATVSQGQMVMLMTMTSLALKGLGCSLSQISFSVALHVMGMFAFSYIFGRLSDSIGRKPVALAGLMVGGVGALLVGLGDTYWVITAGTFLVGLGWSGTFLSANTMLADVTAPEHRGKAMGQLEQFSSGAGMVLPIMGGFIVQYFSLHLLGFVGVAIMLIPVLGLLRIRETTAGEYEQ